MVGMLSNVYFERLSLILEIGGKNPSPRTEKTVHIILAQFGRDEWKQICLDKGINGNIKSFLL